VAIATTIAASNAMANLLANGSFEVNSVVTGGGADDRPDLWSNFTDVASGSPDVWDNSGSDGLAPGSFGFFPHITAFHGTNFVSIAANPDLYSEGIESSPVALTGGKTYRVSIAMAYDSHNAAPWTNPAMLRVRLRKGTDPSTILTDFAANTVDETWEMRSFDFSVSDSGSYSVIFSAEDYSTSNFFVIDHAGLVEVVPEPASMAVLAVASLSLMKRRRN